MLKGDAIQFVLGVRIRNKWTRRLISLPYALQSAPPEWVAIRNEIITGIKVRVYYPQKRVNNALLLFVHGGGWSIMRPGMPNIIVLIFFFNCFRNRFSKIILLA